VSNSKSSAQYRKKGIALPYFSILIPTFNRPRQLHECLESMAEQDYPTDCFEVIVINDGSNVPLGQIIDRFKNVMTLTLLNQVNSGPAAARNFGAEHASGEYLVFTDDDCILSIDFLKVTADSIASFPDCLLGGCTKNQLTGNVCSVTSQIIVDLVYQHYNEDSSNSRFFASNNMVVSTTKFHEIGGFEPTLRTSEDREFCDRWLQHDNRMNYNEKAVIFHRHSLGLKSFCHQHFNYGRGAFKYHRIRAERRSGNFRDDLSFHYKIGKWLEYPFKEKSFTDGVNIAAILMLWQVMNLGGFLFELADHVVGKLVHVKK